MSKEKKSTQLEVVPTVEMPAVSTPTVMPTTPAPLPRLMDLDKMALDLAKSKRETALAKAQTALAENELAEKNFKYLVLQIYVKYSLTERDAISEDGTIIKDGAVAQPQAQ